MRQITCKMENGKLVALRIDWEPKKGDIVVCEDSSDGIYRCWLSIFDRNVENGYISQASVALFNPVCDEPRIENFNVFSENPHTKPYRMRLATSEERNVILFLISKHELELIDSCLVKKQWKPKVGENYWYIIQRSGKFFAHKETCLYPNVIQVRCFKTPETCQTVCDKINELLKQCLNK